MGGRGEYYIEKTEITELAQIIGAVSNKNLPELLDSLLTKRELVDITRRIIIAKMLLAHITHEDISEKTHASKSTIQLVKQSLDENNELLKDVIAQHTSIPQVSPAQDNITTYIKRRLRKGKWLRYVPYPSLVSKIGKNLYSSKEK